MLSATLWPAGFLVGFVLLYIVDGAALKSPSLSRQKRSEPPLYFYGSSGHIESAGYYNGYNYGNNAENTYIIKPEVCQTVPCVLTLNYEHDIEYVNGCVYDRLVFPYDGTVLCGTDAGSYQVEITDGEFPIVFSSDVTENRRGYSIDYTVQPVTTPAPSPSPVPYASGRSLHGGYETERWGDTGNFFSPNYPAPGGVYPYNFDQQYIAHLDSQGPQTVRVQYEIDIESNSRCLFDYIILDDTGDRMCGTHSGYIDIPVDDGTFTVTFHSDNSVVKRGFNLTYAVLPQPTFNSRSAGVNLPSGDFTTSGVTISEEPLLSSPPETTSVTTSDEVPLSSPPETTYVTTSDEIPLSSPPETTYFTNSDEDVLLDPLPISSIVAPGSPSSTEISVGCDPEWTWYAGSCYRPRLRRYTFSQAEEDCMRFDAVVAPAKDEGEFIFLQSLVAGVFPEDRPYWLGADDRETEGEWTWEDGSPVTYAVWAVGARNPLTADGTDCLVVGASGKWKDNECDKLRRFVCKKPPTFVPAVSSGPPAEFVTTATTVETTPVATALPPDVIDDVIDQPDLITLTLPWATTTNGYPPTASVPQPQQGCPDSEIYVSGNSGLLESPGYPEMYPNNCDVTYYVTLDQAGPQTVELSYDDFDLEWHSQCAYDSLVVDGDEDNPQCGVKTGQNMDVEVDGNSFTVKFYSDGSVINRGFSISYSVQDPPATTPAPDDPFGWLADVLRLNLGVLKTELVDLGRELGEMTSRIDDVDRVVDLNSLLSSK